MNKRIFASFFLVIGIFFISGFGCKQKVEKQYSLNLEIWGLFDSSDVYQDIFQAYKDANPNVEEIIYKKMNQETYQQDLVQAMAAGQGPDIFMVHDKWIPSFADKIYPAPAEILGEKKMREDFVDVVAEDFFHSGEVYAVPLSVDSLALFYNKDLFNEAGIASPPKNWEEFIVDAKKMTKISDDGQILQSGAAMGNASNINRATEILTLLMLQNKTMMVDDAQTLATFNNKGNMMVDGSSSPGEYALTFYTQFSNQNASTVPYTWNPRQHYSIDAFSEGTLGMMFNYSWQVEAIKQKSPKLNYAVAPVPQFSDTKVNVANYWGYTVAKNRTPALPENSTQAIKVTNDIRAKEAWKFLTFLTTKADQAIVTKKTVAGSTQVTNSSFDPAKDYLEKTGRPAARRDLIELQKNDPWMGVFAEGNLIARTWYQINPDVIEYLFVQMIEKVSNGEAAASAAIDFAAENINLLMRRQE